jgi:hypothetical protein
MPQIVLIRTLNLNNLNHHTTQRHNIFGHSDTMIEALGQNHASVAMSKANIGYIYEQLGNIAYARSFVEKDHSIFVFSRSLGPDHPDTQRAARGLEQLAPVSRSRGMLQASSVYGSSGKLQASPVPGSRKQAFSESVPGGRGRGREMLQAFSVSGRRGTLQASAVSEITGMRQASSVPGGRGRAAGAGTSCRPLLSLAAGTCHCPPGVAPPCSRRWCQPTPGRRWHGRCRQAWVDRVLTRLPRAGRPPPLLHAPALAGMAEAAAGCLRLDFGTLILSDRTVQNPQPSTVRGLGRSLE